ncbi:MAG: peptidoglycan/LPS O-acetylase OafA/YrhL [Halioglobus sp.]|jgi:peptidoglycan/LPS O-acetylase OafA/YrhL
MSGKIELLEEIRGFSAILVFFSHALFFWWDQWDGLPGALILNVGRHAVMAFFVVSGYLIAGSLLRRVADELVPGFDIRVFVIDRLRRLLPPLVVALIVSFLSYAVLINLNNGYANYLTASQWFGALLFVQDMGLGVKAPWINGPLWSLSHEFWFYMAGALLLLARWYPVRCACLLLIVCIVGYRFGVPTGKWLYGFGVWLSGAGIALALFVSRDLSMRWASILELPSVVIVLLVLVSSLLEMNGINQYVFGVAFALFLSTRLPRKCRKTNRVLSKFAALSPVSYTLYLMHYPMVLLWNELTLSWQTTVPGVAGVTVMGASIIICVSVWIGRHIEGFWRA